MIDKNSDFRDITGLPQFIGFKDFLVDLIIVVIAIFVLIQVGFYILRIVKKRRFAQGVFIQKINKIFDDPSGVSKQNLEAVSLNLKDYISFKFQISLDDLTAMELGEFLRAHQARTQSDASSSLAANKLNVEDIGDIQNLFEKIEQYIYGMRAPILESNEVNKLREEIMIFFGRFK